MSALFSGDAAAALASAGEGLSMLPSEENLRFVRSGALAASGDTGSAVAQLRGLIAARPSWEVIIRSFAAKGLMTLPPSALQELLGDRQGQTRQPAESPLVRERFTRSHLPWATRLSARRCQQSSPR